MGLAATVPMAALAWWGFARRLSWSARLFAGIIVAYAMVMLLTNVADILWFGHSPLLR